MKYTVAIGRDPNNLSQMVNKAIEDGWIPQGGICVVSSIGPTFTGGNFYQALVKIENDKQTEINH